LGSKGAVLLVSQATIIEQHTAHHANCLSRVSHTLFKKKIMRRKYIKKKEKLITESGNMEGGIGLESVFTSNSFSHPPHKVTIYTVHFAWN
jgi:hypothetical protein